MSPYLTEVHFTEPPVSPCGEPVLCVPYEGLGTGIGTVVTAGLYEGRKVSARSPERARGSSSPNNSVGGVSPSSFVVCY